LIETAAQSPGSLALLILVASLVVLLAFRLARLYRPESDTTTRGWLEISADELGASRHGKLALISGLSLFVEMLMIRWVSSEVRVFAYFKNFVLVACFLGFGLGCMLCRRRIHLNVMLAPLLLLTILLTAPLSPLHKMIAGLPGLLGTGSEVHIWGVPAAPASWSGMFLAMLFVVPLFAEIALVFVPSGQLVGWALENTANGVTAYSVNVLASLAGIGGFTALGFLTQPPRVWLLAAGLLSVLVFWPNRRARMVVGAVFLSCVALLSLPGNAGTKTYWSPYQKLTLLEDVKDGKIRSYSLTTNDAWYQQILDLSPEFVRAHPMEFERSPIEWNPYNLPYRFYPAPPSVLVLGAGMGNDVAAALRNGAGDVVAVEIDPLILKLGRNLHFEHPYQSPRTRVVVDDARSYVQNSHEQFDLIVYSLLDSHTTASHFTNIRIDNYVYTREAMLQARRLLRPDGLLIVKFQVETPWIAGRLHALLQDVFGAAPVQFQSAPGFFTTGGRFFVAGSQQRIAAALADPALGAYVNTHSNMPMEPARVTTDDWPYFYQHAPGLPLSVILFAVAVIITLGWFLRQVGGGTARIQPGFFLLGAGFMLLEAQIVSRMALLFGTTWVVNSIVVSGLLCLIVAANMVYQAWPGIPLWWAYAGLMASLVLMFAVPMEKLFFESWVTRALVATLVLCSPVFFAGIVFVSSFAKAHFEGNALGSNLFGSLAGGLLESLSMWFGLKALTLLAAGIYLGSAVALRRVRKAGA
jgi:SAM-dependent methyltransferase